MMTIDHTNIRPDILSLEVNNAKRDPDGQVYPWRDLYPLCGQVVYADGQLWYVGAKEVCPAGDSCDLGLVSLIRVGPTNSDIRKAYKACRYELRPVSWTQDEENVFGGPDHV